MQSKHIDFNITETIFPVPQMPDVHGNIVCCCVPCSPIIYRINAALTAVTPPPPTLQKLSNSFHNMVTAVMAVLYSSRPRGLRLVRSVSSWAFCVALGIFPAACYSYQRHGCGSGFQQRPFCLSNAEVIGLAKKWILRLP